MVLAGNVDVPVRLLVEPLPDLDLPLPNRAALSIGLDLVLGRAPP